MNIGDGHAIVAEIPESPHADQGNVVIGPQFQPTVPTIPVTSSEGNTHFLPSSPYWGERCHKSRLHWQGHSAGADSCEWSKFLELDIRRGISYNQAHVKAR